MSDYRDFGQLRTNGLFVTRHKWFLPYYELTDGQFIYGKLSYKNNFKRYAIIETAKGMWTIKRKGFFNRTLLLNEDEEHTIGSLVPATWKRNIDLKMDNGFEATYLYKKLFARSLTLTGDATGDILQITQRAFRLKKPFEVTFETSKHQNMPPLPLLILIGVSIVLLRQQQAAAH
jgi:hypothetical protein